VTSGKSDTTKAETPQPSAATTSTKARPKPLFQRPPPVKSNDQQKPEIAAKDLVVSTPKLDSLVKVAQQAVQNLQTRETGIKIKEPKAKPEKEKAPPPKRQQHPVSGKGKSAFVNKGKASAPSKKVTKLPEIIKVSVQDLLGSLQLSIQEPRVTSSPRPTDDTAPRPISATDSKEDIQNKVNEQRELPVSQVEQDLLLSHDSLDEDDSSGLCIVDLDDEEIPDKMDDVEPDNTPVEIAA